MLRRDDDDGRRPGVTMQGRPCSGSCAFRSHRCSAGSGPSSGRTTGITGCCSAGRIAGLRTRTRSPVGSAADGDGRSAGDRPVDVWHSYATAGRNAKIDWKALSMAVALGNSPTVRLDKAMMPHSLHHAWCACASRWARRTRVRQVCWVRAVAGGTGRGATAVRRATFARPASSGMNEPRAAWLRGDACPARLSWWELPPRPTCG
jgi:hypothetical protein